MDFKSSMHYQAGAWERGVIILLALSTFHFSLFASPLVESGESLGDRDIGDFYISGHSSIVNSVSYSPNGKQIVSGSYDNTIRVWDIESKKEITTIISKAENWAWLDLDKKRLTRYDGGDFLLNRDKTSFISKEINTTANIEIKVPKSIEIKSREITEFEIEVINRGDKSAFWMEVKSKDSDIVIFQNKIMQLKPNETIKRKLQISSLMRKNIQPYKRKVRLELFSTQIKSISSKEIEVSFKTPNIKIKEAKFDKKEKTLLVTIENRGNQTLKDFDITLFDDKQNIKELKPNQSVKKSFVVEEFEKDKNITAHIYKPLYEWNPTALVKVESMILYYVVLAIFILILIVLIFYYKRYRHPLVIKLTQNEKEIFNLPLESLKEASERMEKIDRLDSILSISNITKKSLQNALSFVDSFDVSLIANRVGATIKKMGEYEEVDLDGSFALNINKFRVYLFDKEEAKDIYNSLSSNRQVSFLLSKSSDVQSELVKLCSDKTKYLVAPESSELTKLLLSPNPKEVLAKIFSNSLSLTMISPYQVGSGVNKESIFFGRLDKISHILNRDIANYLIVGGRQVGKSSLLKALHRRYKGVEEINCHYITLSTNGLIVPKLNQALDLGKDATLEDINEYIDKSDKMNLFLIDEADRFIKKEKENDYQILSVFREMSEERKCAFIMAGFWELYEHSVLDYQSPLKNFAEVIEIGALEEEACRDLITKPMKLVGLGYENSEDIEKIIQKSGKRANLISMVCNNILTGISPTQKAISCEDVDRALKAKNIINNLKGWGTLSGNEELDRLDRVIVYATIDRDRFRLKELVEVLNKCMHSQAGAWERGGSIEISKIENSLSRLILGFILDKNEDGEYFYRVPVFKEYLLREDYEVKLEEEIKSLGR